MTCPSCGSPGAYVGLAKVECDREGCERYVALELPPVSRTEYDAMEQACRCPTVDEWLVANPKTREWLGPQIPPPSIRVDADGAIYFDGEQVGRIVKTVIQLPTGCPACGEPATETQVGGMATVRCACGYTHISEL